MACGWGHYAIWLADRGWQVTALDGSEVAIDRLRHRRPALDARVVDLEDPAFTLAGEYDLILDLFFLYRPLFPQIRQALRPGGKFVAAIRLKGAYALQPAELARFFGDWEILHYAESGHAELIARKPNS